MKLFHISDLHLGKRLGARDITEDMRFVLFELILGEAYAKHRPDGLLISGDIYDRSVPSAESVKMFDDFLAEAVRLKLPVFMISGNHDSAERVSFGRGVFRGGGIFISRPFSDVPPVVEEFGGCDILLLPYFSLEQARAAFPDEEIRDMTAAAKIVLDKARLPRSGRPCIALAHLALGCGNGAAGTLGLVDPAVFSDFAYTALGHYHTPLSFGEHTAYCGSPFCFSKKEAKNPDKYINIIEVADGKVSTERFALVPPHGSVVIRDTLANILSDKYPSRDDYVYVEITENDCLGNNAGRISRKFPNYVSIEYDIAREAAALPETRAAKELSFRELMRGFLREIQGGEMDEETLCIAEKLFEESRRLTDGDLTDETEERL